MAMVTVADLVFHCAHSKYVSIALKTSLPLQPRAGLLEVMGFRVTAGGLKDEIVLRLGPHNANSNCTM